MAVTDQDKLSTQIAGESDSGGPKRLSVDDNGKINITPNQLGEVQAAPTQYTLLGRLKDIVTALAMTTEASVDTGVATGGSQTTVVDTGKSWETDCWKNALIEVVVDDVHYLRFASGNNATTITIAALPGGVAVAAGDSYACKIPVHVTDIERWGGTTVTGRDISLDLKALVDDSIKGILKTLGDIATGENLVTRVGETDDAVVDAGAVGSMAAKLRRLSTDLGALVTAMGEVQASPTENTLLERQKAIETAIVATNTLIGEVQASPTENTVLERLLAVEVAITALDTLVGEVQASPTQYTLLERLKVIDTSVQALLTTMGLVSATPVENTIQERLKALETAVLATNTLIGEVAASPTENTVLERLKTLESTIVLATGTNIIGQVGIDQTTPGTTDRVTANVDKVGGTAQTGRDWSLDFANLDIALSALRDAICDSGASAKTLDDLNTSIGGVQTAVEALRTAKTIDDIEAAVLALRTASTLDTLETAVAAVETDVEATNTRIGEVQASPTANTLLARIKETVDGIDELKALIGEVQASPTENTVLDRIKDLLTGISLTTGSALIGSVSIDQTTPGTTNNVVRGTKGLSNSGVLSGDTAVKASPGAVYWMTISDTAALAIEINDSVAGAGTDVWALLLPAGGYGHFIFDPPIECATGIYLDVSTATCKVTIGYK